MLETRLHNPLLLYSTTALLPSMPLAPPVLFVTEGLHAVTRTKRSNTFKLPASCRLGFSLTWLTASDGSALLLCSTTPLFGSPGSASPSAGRGLRLLMAQSVTFLCEMGSKTIRPMGHGPYRSAPKRRKRHESGRFGVLLPQGLYFMQSH